MLGWILLAIGAALIGRPHTSDSRDQPGGRTDQVERRSARVAWLRLTYHEAVALAASSWVKVGFLERAQTVFLVIGASYLVANSVSGGDNAIVIGLGAIIVATSGVQMTGHLMRAIQFDRDVEELAGLIEAYLTADSEGDAERHYQEASRLLSHRLDQATAIAALHLDEPPNVFRRRLHERATRLIGLGMEGLGVFVTLTFVLILIAANNTAGAEEARRLAASYVPVVASLIGFGWLIQQPG
ncbi:MAG: hypothetical protein QOH61_666 [Chloroflexota bacterium]|jgi:hypothetical protein|nr:hypothetical protein [Chloroflexota bacterium]